MDKIIELIGNEAGPHVTLRDVRARRKELEKIPPPVKVNKFDGWAKEKEKELHARMKTIATTQVQAAQHDIGDLFNPDLLLEYTQKNFEKAQTQAMWPFIQLQYLSMVTEALEATAYAKEREVYDNRFREIDREILRAEQVLPKAFDSSLINRDKRYPVERCGQDKDGRWFDRWLTDGLKSKQPIFFDDKEKYIDALCRYYKEVYWATAERERAEEQVKVPLPPPVEEIPPMGISPAVLEKEGASSLTLRGRIEQKIKGGAR